MTDVEIVARAIMVRLHGGCNVVDWAEREWNPAVRGAWDAAQAALSAATPVIEARVADWRRHEMQMIGAAISTRSWHDLERAYNQLRDKMDALRNAAAIRKG